METIPFIQRMSPPANPNLPHGNTSPSKTWIHLNSICGKHSPSNGTGSGFRLDKNEFKSLLVF